MKPEEQTAAGEGAARYAYDVDPASKTTAARVVELVGRDNCVLELGCATGHMSRVLAERGCKVVAIEIDADAALQASQHCERIIVGDIEELDFGQELAGETFDVLLAADVLEHLKDPAVALLGLRPFLRADGHLVASIPNVAHGSVRLALLGGEFPYTHLGLLERTHLRFYTRRTLEEMLGEGGFQLDDLHRQQRDLDGSEVPFDGRRLPAGVAEAVGKDPEAETYQFVVTARPVAPDGQPEPVHDLRRRAEKRRAAVDARLEERRRQLEDAEARDAALVQERAERAALAERCDALTAALLEQLEPDGSSGDAPPQAEEQAAAAHADWYARVVNRVRETVRATVPENARVAVISKGDDQLLDLGDREGWHFPQTDTGLYAGFYPADGSDAVSRLEQVRSKGAEFLVIPASALWWLDHYPEFREHLDRRWRLVTADPDGCRVYAIAEQGAGVAARTAADLSVAQTAPQVSSWLDALLPPEAGVAAIGAASQELDLGSRRVWRLPDVDPEDRRSLEEAVLGLEDAASDGASYVVLVRGPGRRARASMQPLARAVAERGRPLALQALAEVFELHLPAGVNDRRFDDQRYRRLKQEIPAAVDPVLPASAQVLVVSRGDDELLALGRLDARHFPQDADGRYSGYHPADSAEALAALDDLRRKGAEYLLFPPTSFWWLDHYPELATHLAKRCRRVIDDKRCVAFDIRSPDPSGNPRAESAIRRRLRKWRAALPRLSHDDGGSRVKA